MPKVSVLVACYNISKYIDKFLTNLLNQNFEDFEVILVNDGSTDDTLEKLKHWEERDNRIKVYSHEHNMGLGATRNTTLSKALGEYIYFADADDEMYPDILSACVEKMDETKADLMIFGFDAVYADKSFLEEHIKFKERYLKSNQEIRDIFVDELLLVRNGNGFVWNKFYRKSFLDKNNLRFENQAIQQDEPFNLNVYQAAEKLYISPLILYRYYIYSQGNNGARYIPNRFEIFIDIRNKFEALLTSWDLKNSKTDKYLNERFWSGMQRCLLYDLKHQNCDLSSKDKKERYREIVNHPFSKLAITFKKHNISKKDLQAFTTLYSLSCPSLFYFQNNFWEKLKKLLKR